jgi:hypothetical protein
MDTSPFWLLTDAMGQTTLGGASWLRWGRSVTHTVWAGSIAGYCCDSVHLPCLMDPVYERYGATARLWLSEVHDVRAADPVRVASHSWTVLDEWERPTWVDGPLAMKVRLRFGLLAAAAAHPNPETAARIRTTSLREICVAGSQMERVCAESRRHGRVPQATCLAAMAVRSAAALKGGTPELADLVSRHYPVYAWYAAMAAACACVDLSELADEAVRWETQAIRSHKQTEAMAMAMA